jgi:hypothetical protein
MFHKTLAECRNVQGMEGRGQKGRRVSSAMPKMLRENVIGQVRLCVQ